MNLTMLFLLLNLLPLIHANLIGSSPDVGIMYGVDEYGQTRVALFQELTAHLDPNIPIGTRIEAALFVPVHESTTLDAAAGPSTTALDAVPEPSMTAVGEGAGVVVEGVVGGVDISVEGAPVQSTMLEAVPTQSTTLEPAPVQRTVLEPVPTQSTALETIAAQSTALETVPTQSTTLDAVGAEEADVNIVAEKVAEKVLAMVEAALSVTVQKMTLVPEAVHTAVVDTVETGVHIITKEAVEEIMPMETSPFVAAQSTMLDPEEVAVRSTVFDAVAVPSTMLAKAAVSGAIHAKYVAEEVTEKIADPVVYALVENPSPGPMPTAMITNLDESGKFVGAGEVEEKVAVVIYTTATVEKTHPVPTTMVTRVRGDDSAVAMGYGNGTWNSV